MRNGMICPHVRFFCVLGRDQMKNRLFIAAEDAVNRRKLDVTLRRFTSDRLTEEQRQIIEMAVGYQRQCCISVCPTVQKFR